MVNNDSMQLVTVTLVNMKFCQPKKKHIYRAKGEVNVFLKC